MTFNFMRATASMRTRLIVIPASILVLAIITSVVVTLYHAKSRIRSEGASGINVGTTLITYALDDVATSPDPEAALRRLQTELENVRHISVRYKPRDGIAKIDKTSSSENEADAPKWFLDFFDFSTPIKFYPVTIKGEPHGELIMSTKPSDEVAEIWHDLAFLTGLLILLRHNFLRREPLLTGVAQHGHRKRVLTSAMINLLRIVAIELGTWRSVLGGGASELITFGNGKFFEPRGVARS